VHDLVQTHLEGSRDVFVHKDFPGLDFNNIVFPNSIDHSDVSLIYSLPSPSLDFYIDMPIENPMICDANNGLGYENIMFNMLGGNVDNFISLGYFYGYDASFDPYSMYLVDKPRKIMLNTFFSLSFDFSMALALLKRTLTFFAVIIFMLSYCHA